MTILKGNKTEGRSMGFRFSWKQDINMPKHVMYQAICIYTAYSIINTCIGPFSSKSMPTPIGKLVCNQQMTLKEYPAMACGAAI